MIHVALILGTLIYCIVDSIFIREWLDLLVTVYIAYGIILLLQKGRKLLPVIILLFLTNLGIAQRKTRAVQIAFGVERVEGLARNKITKPIPIQMPYYRGYINPNVSLRYRISNSESNIYSNLAYNGLSAGVELNAAIMAKLWRRTYTDKVKIGIFFEGVMDYDPARYKPAFNLDGIAEDVGVTTIKDWLAKQQNRFAIPDYTKTKIPTLAGGAQVLVPFSIEEKYQVVFTLKIREVGLFDKVQASAGFYFTLSKNKLDYGINHVKILH